MYLYLYNTPVMYVDNTGTLPEWIEDIGRFFGGAIITLSTIVLTATTVLLLLIPGAASIPLFTLNMAAYGSMLMLSPFSGKIKSDMRNIGWNPFNDDESLVLSSSNISFYKSVFVIRYGGKSTIGGGISFLVIGIGRGETRLSTVRHEYGHHKQQRLLGLGLYTPVVAIPSLISAATSSNNTHSNRWYEKWATNWGNRGFIWW